MFRNVLEVKTKFVGTESVSVTMALPWWMVYVKVSWKERGGRGGGGEGEGGGG